MSATSPGLPVLRPVRADKAVPGVCSTVLQGTGTIPKPAKRLRENDWSTVYDRTMVGLIA